MQTCKGPANRASPLFFEKILYIEDSEKIMDFYRMTIIVLKM